MKTTFISLAISDTMFPDSATLVKSPLSPEQVSERLNSDEVLSALNPSHATTINLIQRKYGFVLPIPEKAPKVALESGDSLIVLQAQLPRLAEGEIHTVDTVENAKIHFSLWEVK